MIKIGMTFNGKTVTSSSQLKREFEKAARKALDENVRRAAPAGVRVSKTAKGYKLEGSEAKVKRALKKLGHI
jgi:diketogulonate reductase-like aldo/keto reductase